MNQINFSDAFFYITLLPSFYKIPNTTYMKEQALNSNPSAIALSLIVISGLFLIASPGFAQEMGTGYDSAGNYIEDAAIDEKQYREKAIARLEKKENEFIEKIKKDPQNHLYHYFLGKIYLEQDRPGKAIAALTEAVKINPKYGKSHFQLANAFDRMNDTTQAIHHMALASEIFEYNLDLHWQTKTKAFLMQLQEKK